MEPQDGSTLGGFPSHLLFEEHRGNGKNLSDIKTPDTSFLVDSGYISTSTHGSSIVSNPSTPSLNSGSIPAELLTPQRYLVSGNSSTHLGTVLEQAEAVDAVKLTPVTENIRSICNFHITTPKDEQYAPGAKRNVAAILNFQDFESTPKKPRVDVVQQIENVPGDIFCNTTPRKASKLRSNRKKSFRKKLKSAPDLDFYFNANNIENEKSPRRGNISPIFDKSESRGSRTPLSSSNSNLLRISTPKSSNHTNNHGGLYDGKPTSVKKLLTFSDSQFEHLLRVDQKQDLLSSSTAKKTPPIATNRSSTTSTTSTKKCLAESFVRAGNSCSNFELNASIQPGINESIRPLSFNTTASSEDNCDISAEQASRKFRKIFSVTSTVLRDRELSRRHLTSSIKSLQKPYGSRNDEKLLATNATSLGTTTTKTTKKCKTETESQGFQDILNISNDCCHDMEISAICENDSRVVEEASGPVSANYDIESAVDLNLNDSIECEGKSPPRSARKHSVEESRLVRRRSIETASLIPLPRTPKKIKPAPVDRERYEILYPIIHRTPSKYNAYLRRAAYKRKSVQNLSNNFKRQCKYYGGNTYLNIIAKLGSYGHILQRIFRCVTPKDLANMCEVSIAWRQAVQSNRWAWQQAENYREECKSLKENEGYAKFEPEVAKEQRSVEVFGASYNKTPFNQSNIRVDRKRSIDENRSPPVSPSKRKFHDNQKVVRTLAPNEKLVKCPRCNKSSRIFNVFTSDTNHHNNNNKTSTIISTNKSSHSRSLSETFHLTNKKPSNPTHHRNLASLFDSLQQVQPPQSSMHRHSLTTPEMPYFPQSLSSSTSSKHRPIDSTLPRMRFGKSLSYDSAFLAPDEPMSPFAECSGIVCGYRFCPECLCDYHPTSKCQVYQPSSPSKDDGQSDLLTPAVTKKNTRRKILKRLCF